MTPRILFTDENLTRTDIDLLSLIISLALNSNYCYANNKYLADYINTSIRTISDSLTRLRTLKYIIVKKVNGNRRIYLNTEKIPIKVATDIAENCSKEVAENCDHNINSKYKNKYRNKYVAPVPYWMEHPEVIKKEPPNEEELKELEEILKEYK